MPGSADAAAIRPRLLDDDPAVREAAVRALSAVAGADTAPLVEELLASEHAAVRTATLACLARGEIRGNGVAAARQAWAARPRDGAAESAEARVERALAAGTLPDGDAVAMLLPFLADPDPRVASTALRSAGLLANAELFLRIVDGLGRPATREAARDALAANGAAVLPALAARLLDPAAPPAIRRSIPSVLARIPSEATVEALLRSALAPETDQVLDYRTIKALGKLRAQRPGLRFPNSLVRDLLAREIAAARRYADAFAALPATAADPLPALLRRSLLEAWRERRETTFRTLGLLYDPVGIHRCYLALVGAETAPRANALEWLETTVGHTLFGRLAPVLDEPAAAPRARAGSAPALDGLAGDEDHWVARCAAAALGNGARPRIPDRSEEMDLIEKVFLLQKVDLLRDARSSHLAMLASIADEIDVAAGAPLLREGEPTDALYVVLDGEVELHGMGGTLAAAAGKAFGTWALIDQAPSVVDARATRPSRLLRITRDDFHDLVGDHPELAIGLLQGLARRVRTLVP
jgi:hypothetical protein